jgi:hypothetical protein
VSEIFFSFFDDPKNPVAADAEGHDLILSEAARVSISLLKLSGMRQYICFGTSPFADGAAGW